MVASRAKELTAVEISMLDTAAEADPSIFDSTLLAKPI